MASAPFTLLASTTQTASGSQALGLVDYSFPYLNLHLVVTAASGTTPTLQMKVQWSNDGTSYGDAFPNADGWTTNITAAGTYAIQVMAKGPYMRLVWTVGGTTPSFTFQVTAS